MPAFAVVTQKSRFCHFCRAPLRWYVVETDQINILSFAMLGDFEEIEDTEESRHTCQLGCNVGKPDQFDGVNFDLSLIHAVSTSPEHMGPDPEPDSASDLPSPHSLAQPVGECHNESPPPRESDSFHEFIRQDMK